MELERMKDPLEGEGHRLLTIVTLCRHLVDSLAQEVGEVEHLQKRVQVAGGALVLEASLLLAVPGHCVGSISVHLYLKDYTVILR